MVKALFLTVGLSIISSASVLAYPSKATMDYTWGFDKGYSRGKQIVYYQYGARNWRESLDFGVDQINNNPAAVSCYYGSSYSSAAIVVSSNYWYDATWNGNTYAPKSLSQKTVQLNSAGSSSPSLWKSNGTATHELTHVWGINDSEDSNSISYGYSDRSVNIITSDVTALFKSRYN